MAQRGGNQLTVAWKVITDHTQRDSDEFSAVGIGQFTNPNEPMPHRCKLYDDDGILYYTVAYDDVAESDDEADGGLYQCFHWGMTFAGTTDLRIKGEAVYG